MTIYQRGDEEISPVVATNVTSGNDQVLEELAEQIGERSGVLTARLDITNVLEQMKQGVLVTLRIEGPRRFWKKITPQDLGLSVSEKFSGVLSDDANEVLSDYFQLGRLSLLPKDLQDRLQTVERKARYCLARYSFQSHWGSFVPVTAYQKWKEENTKYEEEFRAIRDELLSNYEEIVAQVLETYRPVAEAAWRMVTVGKKMSNSASLTSELVNELSQKLEAQAGRDEFVKHYLDAIRYAIKPKDKVASSFKYTYERSYIPLPTTLAHDLDEAERIYGERRLQDEQLQLELERIEATRQREQQELYFEQRRQWEEQSLRSQAERDRLHLQLEMERDVLREAQRNRDVFVREFFRDVVGHINDMIQDICLNVLDNLEEHQGQLRGPVSRQLKNLVEQIQLLNFMNVEEVERQIASIREVLPTKEESEQVAKGVGKIDTTRLVKAVKRVQEEARSVVIDLGLTPTVRKKREVSEPLAKGALLDVTKRQARATPALEEPGGEDSQPTRKREKRGAM